MKKLVLGLLCLGVLFLPGISYAQLDPIAFQEALNDLNRIKPLQNPKFEKAQDLLSRKIIDQQNKIVGQVQDILFFQDDGAVSMLEVVFDRLHLNDAVYLDYQQMNIGTASDAYQLGFRDTEVNNLYPEMVSKTKDIEDNHDALRLKRLLGRPLLDGNGKQIGEVQDILFGERGAQVQAIFININTGTLRNIGIALPFASITFKEYHDRITAYLPQAQTDQVLDYAKKL